ncbi:MAG: universal stress protein [Hymenobacter sp.]
MQPTLLVLTDFSAAAGQALAHAARLAEAIGGQLVLLHVQRQPLPGSALADLTEEAARRALDALLADLPVPATAELAQGDVLPAVLAALSHHQPDLVVLGRPGPGAHPEALASTTAVQLLQHALCPMLVVPPTGPEAAAPRRLLLAADGDGFSLGSCTGLMRHLLTALPAHLTVLHCSPYIKPGDGPLRSVLQTGLTAGLAPPRTIQVINMNPVEGIQSAARPADYDALVMLARRRSRVSSLFHRSLTVRVMLSCPLPVLVLPAQ